MKARPGRSLERTAAAIETAFGAYPAAEISSPGHLVDKDTGGSREFDVLIEVRKEHHDLRIAIECRDRSRKVTVNEVEGFAKKCEATGVDIAYIVSPKGFWKTALLKAKRHDIRCLSINAVECFDWMQAKEANIFTRQFRTMNVVPIIDSDIEPDRPAVIIDLEGKPADLRSLYPSIRAVAAEKAHCNIGTGHTLTFEGKVNGLRLVLTDTGEIVPIVGLSVEMTFDVVEVQPAPFEKTTYGPLEAAIARIDVGEFKGQIVVLKDGDSQRATFVPDAAFEAQVAEAPKRKANDQ